MADVFQKFAEKLDNSKRSDLVLLNIQKVGMRDIGYIYNARFYFDEKRGCPKRSHIQEAITGIYGSRVVLNPKEVKTGATSLIAQIISRDNIDSVAIPKPQFYVGLRRATEEKVSEVLVEKGDQVRVIYQGRVVEGTATNVSPNDITLSVQDIGVITVPREQVVAVMQIPTYAVRDQEAYDYFIQLFPDYYTRSLTSRQPSPEA